MLERFLELFNKPVGYLLILGIFMTIICTVLKLKKEYKPIGYIKLNDSLNSTLYFAVLFMFFGTLIFTILYSNGIKDTSGNELDGHIYIFLVVLLYECFAFLLSHYKNIYFNDNEIKVYSIFRKTRTYSWNDIVSVKRNKMNDLIIKTINGNKITVEFSFDNIKKLEKKLEEKNIVTVE